MIKTINWKRIDIQLMNGSIFAEPFKNFIQLWLKKWYTEGAFYARSWKEIGIWRVSYNFYQSLLISAERY